MSVTLATPADLETEAQHFIHSLVPRERAILVTLSGELGAGKTTFSQAIARALGVDEVVTSPTFVLEKIYALPSGSAFKRLVHIDAYRLEGGAELTPLGLDALLRDPDNLILLEWPERVAGAIPEADYALMLVPQVDGSRLLTYA